jgi:hypothetical protein
MSGPLDGNGGNGRDSLGVNWGDRGVNAKGPLGLAVFVVALAFCLAAFAVWWGGWEIRKAAEVVAQGNREGVASLLDQLKRVELGQKVQHDDLAARQALQSCLSSYDFASRQRLRKRAEDGELRLDAWCKWMDALR